MLSVSFSAVIFNFREIAYRMLLVVGFDGNKKKIMYNICLTSKLKKLNLVYTSAPLTCWAIRVWCIFGTRLINFLRTWGEQRTPSAWKGHSGSLKLGPHDVWFVFVMHHASWIAHRMYEKICLIWVDVSIVHSPHPVSQFVGKLTHQSKLYVSDSTNLLNTFTHDAPRIRNTHCVDPALYAHLVHEPFGALVYTRVYTRWEMLRERNENEAWFFHCYQCHVTPLLSSLEELLIVPFLLYDSIATKKVRYKIYQNSKLKALRSLKHSVRNVKRNFFSVLQRRYF